MDGHSIAQTIGCVQQQHKWHKMLSILSQIKATNTCETSETELQHKMCLKNRFNLYTPNVNYSWRTASLTFKIAFYIFIQQI